MTSLIISLPLGAADNAALFDYVLSPDGSTVDSHASVPLALLPAQTDRQSDVVAIVKAQALSWHQVRLPQGSLSRSMFGERGSTRLRAILEGLLEDQLLDDPAQLHLALQPQPDATGLVWVAACDRAWLNAALAALAAAGHQVSRIVPEFTPQLLADAIYVTGDADSAQVAGLLVPASGDARPTGTARAAVLMCDLSATAVALLDQAGAALSAGVAPDSLAAGMAVVAEPAVASLAELAFKRPVTLQQRAPRLLQAALGPWDLAQFDLAHASRDRRWSQISKGVASFFQNSQWRAARWALVAVVMGNLIGLNAWALHEQSGLQAQRQMVLTVLTDTFPKIPVVVDAPLQMAREVAALQRASGSPAGSDLESMLSYFAAVAPVKYVPTAIEYVANELRLTGPVPSAQEQAKAAAGLKAQGLNATSQGEQWLIVPGVKP